jgi:ABC-type sugar transport system ATPase subunit
MLGKVAERSKVERRGAGARDGLVVIDQLSVPGHITNFGLRASGGEIVAIVGQVGSGASKVLRTLAGLMPDARGYVSIAGRPMRLGAPAAVDSGRRGVRFQRPKKRGIVSAPVRRPQPSGDSLRGG